MIPYGRQTIEEDDIQAVVDVLRSDYLTTGPKIAEFEKNGCGLCRGEICGGDFKRNIGTSCGMFCSRGFRRG